MRGASPAFITRGESVSYEALKERVDTTTRRLWTLDVRAGERIALRAANGADWIVLTHAIWKIGATIVPLSTRLTDAEIAEPLERARIRLLLGDAPLPPSVSPGCRTVSLEELRLVDPAPELAESVDPNDIDRERTVLFTSGTSGRPKGAILTGRNHVASARACAAVLPLGPGDRWLASLPFFHVGGLNIIHRCALRGACVVIPDSPAAEDLNRAINQEGVTHASFVDTLLRRVLIVRKGMPLPPTLRAIVVGGGPVSQATMDDCPQALASYGLTESCSMATLVRPGALERERRSAGMPLPGIDLRIASDGRIEIRGEIVMREYLDDPDATRAAVHDGWLRTGDTGEIDDDGCLWVISRREDLIISGGENIYPMEIETALRTHPDVVETVVVGVSDREWGEVPLALIVRRSVDVAELRSYLAKRLAAFKIPRIVPVDAIPLLPNGKPDRALIRSRYASPTPPRPSGGE